MELQHYTGYTYPIHVCIKYILYLLRFLFVCFKLSKKLVVLKVPRWICVNIPYGYPIQILLWIITDWYCRTIVFLTAVEVDLGCSLAWLWNDFLAQSICFLLAWVMCAHGCLQSWLKLTKFSHDFQNYFQCSSFILFIRTIGTWLSFFIFYKNK